MRFENVSFASAKLAMHLYFIASTGDGIIMEFVKS